MTDEEKIKEFLENQRAAAQEMVKEMRTCKLCGGCGFIDEGCTVPPVKCPECNGD